MTSFLLTEKEKYMPDFHFNKIPTQKGRIAIVTGANSGLGYETAKFLAKKDFEVILACRNMQKAKKAKAEILKSNSSANLQCIELDLSSLLSVRTFAEEFQVQYTQLDLLINNAGIMMPPYSKTEDGFESQLGINYFGHFLLTGLLLETLERTADSRVVHLSSLAHRWGTIDFEDLNYENKKYSASKAYGQSKLACLMFSYELQRRFQNKNYQIKSVAAHPGMSSTNLTRFIPKFLTPLAKIFNMVLGQSAEQGALPTIRAALDNNVKGGEYFGPGGFKEYKGNPVQVDSSPESKDRKKAKKLWDVSENLTQIIYS